MWSAGLSLLDNILAAVGGTKAGIDLHYQQARTAVFEFDGGSHQFKHYANSPALEQPRTGGSRFSSISNVTVTFYAALQRRWLKTANIPAA
ncbi:MAG: hypothetical protein ABJB74_09905 [Gemmatimonas sp.]